MTDVFDALRTNNANVGGGYIVREGEARYIRGESQAHGVADIAAIVIDERDGVPVTIADVAEVHPAPMIRAGLVDPRRPGRGRHRAGHDAHRRELAAGGRAGQGRRSPRSRRACRRA